MFNSLFIDSINAISSELETNIIHLITNRKRSSEKVEGLRLEVLQFKAECYKNILRLIKT